MKYAAAIALPLLLLSGCLEVIAGHPPVPMLPTEQVPTPPRSNVTLIWQPGHYDWDGGAYTWVHGEWVDRANHGTLWQDGFWRSRQGTSIWVPGHWV